MVYLYFEKFKLLDLKNTKNTTYHSYLMLLLIIVFKCGPETVGMFGKSIAEEDKIVSAR